MRETIFNEDFFKKLNKINMYINFKLSGGTQGGRKSKAKGVSVEFSDYREYAPGDDFRRIDWNAYGRFDKFFVKVFMEEREGLFNFFIDKSKSMDYGKYNKKETALKIVAALSYIALNNLDRVNISTMNDGVIENLKTSTGNKGFQKILRDLENINFDGSTDLSSSIKKRHLNLRGISIVVSLLGMREDNNWIMDAGQIDLFRLRNRIATEIWNDFGHGSDIPGKQEVPPVDA